MFNFVRILKSKMTSPFDWNEAARLASLIKFYMGQKDQDGYYAA